MIKLLPKPKIVITDEEWGWFRDNCDGEGWECSRCGGNGFIELVDAPELWGEDCLSEENRLIPCPECREIERNMRRIILEHRYEKMFPDSLPAFGD
jgi:hypothetical protein